jgi:hypothetical protein
MSADPAKVMHNLQQEGEDTVLQDDALDDLDPKQAASAILDEIQTRPVISRSM